MHGYNPDIRDKEMACTTKPKRKSEEPSSIASPEARMPRRPCATRVLHELVDDTSIADFLLRFAKRAYIMLSVGPSAKSLANPVYDKNMVES